MSLDLCVLQSSLASGLDCWFWYDIFLGVTGVFPIVFFTHWAYPDMESVTEGCVQFILEEDSDYILINIFI